MSVGLHQCLVSAPLSVFIKVVMQVCSVCRFQEFHSALSEQIAETVLLDNL